MINEAALPTTPPFMIERYVLEPAGVALAPRGHVVHVGFAGSVAYAWVRHELGAPIDMQLMTLPSGGPFEFTIDEANFHTPVHVGSFFKTSNKQTLTKGGTEPMISAWHTFVFMPKHAGNIIRPN